MNIDGIGFNAAWIAARMEKEFLKEFSLPAYAHIYAGDPKREAKLKTVYRLCLKYVDAVVLNNS